MQMGEKKKCQGEHEPVREIAFCKIRTLMVISSFIFAENRNC
jgi:hypothetical protein